MFHDAETAKRYILAGRSIVTLESEKTGKHITYKVTSPKDNDKIRFVSLLTGQSNTSDYTYIGMLKDEFLVKTKKSQLDESSAPFAAFNYMMSGLNAGTIRDQLKIMHNGHCGRCGRLLTVPHSIETGIGPECAKKMGFSAQESFI